MNKEELKLKKFEKFSRIRLWLFNLVCHPEDCVERCLDCGKVQKRAIDWDHQRCLYCGSYLYDHRLGDIKK